MKPVKAKTQPANTRFEHTSPPSCLHHPTRSALRRIGHLHLFASRRFAGAALLALALYLPRPTCAATESSPPIIVSRATDIIDQWQPSRHVYVKGNLGVGQTQLSALETWIANHAPHWTVVLLESAADETFTDPAGESFTGMDAVEHALGKGLPNRTSFSALTDPRTGERNGAFLAIFLRERKFSYFASETHDRRALGEDHWIGQLDQPAIAAMRDGGRILDAVQDTITHIEDRLTRALTAERADRERQETAARLARQQETEKAKAAVTTAATTLHRLDNQVRELLESRPGLTGDLARPDLDAWRANLAAAQEALNADHTTAAHTLAYSVHQQASTHARALDQYLRAGDEFAALTSQLDRLANLPHHLAATTTLETARSTLKDAQTAHDQADPAYTNLLLSVRDQLTISEQQIRAAAARATRQSQLLITGSSLGLLALLALGVILNRRRRPHRRKALELLAAWSNALGDKSVALAELVDSAQSILGLSSEDVTARFDGLTLELGQQTVRDVDEACIMAVCAQRIHRIAEATARPTRLGPHLYNLFGAANYRTAIRQLRDEPIVFHPEERLEIAVRGPKTTYDRLLGHLESYQPFRMAFNDLMEAFSQRSGRALAALDRIHASLSRLHTDSTSIEQRILSLKATENALSAYDTPTDIFRLQALFSELLPAAHADQADADQIGARDPVGALEKHLAAAQRKCTDAEALTRVAVVFHQETYPALAAAAQKLAEAQLTTRWIETAAAELSDHAEELARQAMAYPMTTAITQLAERLQQLLSRTTTTVNLDQQRRESTLPTLDAADQTIVSARQELALRLNLDQSDILRETGSDPSDVLNRAREQVVAAKAALDLGDTDAAQHALDAAADSCDEATSIVDQTRIAADQHRERLASSRNETARLEQALPAHKETLASLTTTYPPSALLLGQGDPAHPNANGTVADNLTEVDELLHTARQLTDRAAEIFAWAHILEADALLDQASANHQQAAFRLAEIAEKQQRILRTETANDQLARSLAAKVDELAPRLTDPRTTAQTRQHFDALRQQLTETEARRTAPVRDPFNLAAELATLEQALAQTADATRHDWTLHAEIQGTLQSAALELDVAQRLAQKAANDSITDSTSITQASQELHSLHPSLQAARDQIAQPHGNWHTLTNEADHIAHDATRITALLRHELQAANAAQTALSAATAQMRAASGWRGLLGVAILGAPGSEQLRLARTALNQGAYQAAQHAAEAARQAATLAIAQAEAEQRRRQRAEQERRDHERRQRERADRRRRQAARTSSFGSSFGRSSGARRSGFSSGSGTSRSSFRSSSGARRSGW